MVARERQESWSEFLDTDGANKLFIRLVFAPNFKDIEEFALIYVTIIGGVCFEVIRYDCNNREAVHVHNFSKKPPEKRRVEKEASVEAMREIAEEIRKNWRLHLSKFLEK
jgi:hypothetical protein